MAVGWSTDSLPDYELLDRILDDYVEGDRGYADLLSAGFAPELVDRVLRSTEHGSLGCAASAGRQGCLSLCPVR